MPNPRNPKPDMTTRQIKALGKLGRTKHGREFIQENRELLFHALVMGVGKP